MGVRGGGGEGLGDGGADEVRVNARVKKVKKKKSHGEEEREREINKILIFYCQLPGGGLQGWRCKWQLLFILLFIKGSYCSWGGLNSGLSGGGLQGWSCLLWKRFFCSEPEQSSLLDLLQLL